MIKQVENPVLEVHDLSVRYDKKPVLWGVDFSLPTGKMIGVMGPNGSGKSTLLKTMIGLVNEDSGYIKIFGRSPSKVLKRISYVPQKESVDWDFPARVLDVVMMGRHTRLGLFKRAGKEDKEIAMDALEKVKMADFKSRHISQLSGGQQQRVFIARALAQQAELYLMDEPFAGVDISSEKIIMDLLFKLRDEGKTIIVVHHNLQNASDYFQWLVMLNLRLVASGPAEEVLTDKILTDVYGGTLTTLTEVSEEVRKKNIQLRESNN